MSGITLLIVVTSDIRFRAADPVKRSRTMASGKVVAAPEAQPWINRKMSNAEKLEAKEQASAEIAKSRSEMSNIGLRPKRSASGPPASGVIA